MVSKTSLAALALGATMAASLAGADELEVRRIDSTGPLKDPGAAFWADVPAVTVAMQPQNVTNPRHADIAVDELKVRAVHNGRWIGILIEWRDDHRNNLMRIDEFGDQVAVQFPVAENASPMMGNPDGRVNIIQWRAAFQRDLDDGDLALRDLYPNALIDIYPDEVLRLTDARAYTGAMGMDNPVSRPFESPVLDQMAEGWGSLTVKPMQHADGHGAWEDGTWRVAITRPLSALSPGDPELAPGTETQAAFAVWDGANREVGARKAWSNWLDVEVED